MKRLTVLVLLVALVGAACGNDDNKSSTGGGGKAQTFAVQVDGDSPDVNATFLAYFPHKLKAHPGDTVTFSAVDTGEPHTVTFGTLVDQGLAKVDPKAQEDQQIPELAKMPELLPEGPGDANQTAAQPCFLATGDPPADGCSAAQKTQPDFDGTQTFYNSGWLAPDQTYSMTLADDVKPGTYKFFCLLHREAMTGEVDVVDADTDIPTPAAVKQAGDDDLAAKLQKLQPAVDQLRAATADQAMAGNGLPDPTFPGLVLEFGPKEISIPVGGTVAWAVAGPHTISFNAPEDARPLLSKAPDGSVHINPKTVTPAASPGQPPPAEGPPPSEPVVIDGGSFNGTGFKSPGLILSFGPPGVIYKVKFTKAGTFEYKCLVHPDMEGTVKVG